MMHQISIFRQTLHFHSSFTIAYEKVTTAEVIIIKLVDRVGNVGLGSAAPDTEVTGESLDAVFHILTKKFTTQFFEYDMESWYSYHDKIQKVFSEFPSAQAAVEEAYLNLWSCKYNIPLHCFFGGYRKTCQSMITIGIQSVPETVQEVENRLQEGFKIIKLKCGLNVDEDFAKIQEVHQILPPDSQLVLDANQGYSILDAKKIIHMLKNVPIAFFEQPIESKDWHGLQELHLQSNIPIIADESVVSYEDAYTLLTQDYVSGVNIKLMKCGGPINFMKIFFLAKKLQKKVMIGCMYESNISITMGAHVALGLPLDYVDLDSGHLDFFDDPSKGGATILNSKITINSPLELPALPSTLL